MYTKNQIQTELKRQLSIDYNCTPEAFDREENTITVSALNEGRRIYKHEKYFFSLVTLGKGAVISADERIIPFLESYVRDKRGVRLFEHGHLTAIEAELSKYGKNINIRASHHMLLPDPAPLNIEPDFEVKWYERNELGGFYGDPAFSNALCEEPDPDRPDVLAVAAIIGGKIAGMAGCSADTKIMWQIGIDVLPEYRGRGIGAALVGLLKDEILKRGFIPFYGTSPANIHSQRIAVKCGFYPAWVETENS